MLSEQVKKEIIKIIEFITDKELIDVSGNLFDIGINSLEYVRLIVGLEEKFGIEFTYDFYENYENQNIDDIVTYILGRIDGNV